MVVNATTFVLPHGHAYGVNDYMGKMHDGFVLNYDPTAPPTEDQQNISKIQRFLSVLPQHGGDDGYFAPKTARYVAAWQEQNGLAVTGIVNQETWEAMNL